MPAHRNTVLDGDGVTQRISGSARMLALCALAGLMALSACNQRKTQVAFDGIYFRSKTKKVDKDLSTFNATVWPVSASFEAARRAAEHEGTKYCVTNFGSSRINWIIGPETEVSRLVITDDKLTYQGTCNP